eukprot:8996785-Pyramimonas_sp.AAC.1
MIHLRPSPLHVFREVDRGRAALSAHEKRRHSAETFDPWSVDGCEQRRAFFLIDLAVVVPARGAADQT